MSEGKLSAVIITFNEEENIERCIRSVAGIANEIIVVDSFSTDGTEGICRSLNVRFLKHKFEGHIEQKNYALSMASYDHVISLDADEALSDELRSSIHEIRNHWQYDGYEINRLNNYCGTFVFHGGWYPDRRIRLWNRKKGAWGGVNPHDTVIMQAGTVVKSIKGDILHYTYRNLSEHLRQMDKFAGIAATEAFKKNKKTSVIIHLVLNPAFLFFKNYFLRLGFLDGYAGFLLAANGAYYRFLKYARLKALCDARP